MAEPASRRSVKEMVKRIIQWSALFLFLPSTAYGQVCEEQMVIDDDEIGLLRCATRAHHMAVFE